MKLNIETQVQNVEAINPVFPKKIKLKPKTSSIPFKGVTESSQRRSTIKVKEKLNSRQFGSSITETRRPIGSA